MTITCYRSGLYSGVRKSGPISGQLVSNEGGFVTINFGTGGLYRGTRWRVDIGPQSFENLAKAMMETNPNYAVLAFCNAIAASSEDKTD